MQIDDILQPDIESIDSAWNKLEQTIDQIESRLKKSKKLQIDLDLIEQDMTIIEQKVSENFDHLSTINHINEIQVKLEKILNYCQTLSLPNLQTQFTLEKINQLNLRISSHLNGFHHRSRSQVNQPEIA